MFVTPTDVVKPEVDRHDFGASKSARDILFDAAFTVKTVVHFTRMQRLRKKARWVTKKFIVFMLSHVGLTTLVGLYAVAGGFIFQRLESNMDFDHTQAGHHTAHHPAHESNHQPAQSLRKIAAMRNVSVLNNSTFQSLRQLHVDELWNVTVSLNVLKPDLWKDIVNLDLLAFERDLYQAILKDGYETIQELGADKTTERPLAELDMPHKPTEWNYPSSLLFAVTVITTIGYGDTVPKSWEAKMVCIVYALFGIPLTLLCLANLGSLLASVYRFTWKHASHLTLIIVRAPERNNPLQETSQVRVPITISLSTMVVYILGGAAIFSEWENWSFLEGSYFCFITLSTIGFGDYVPGKDTETLDSNAKRVVCALYLLFGLALLSMIFQLIQDSVTIVIGRYASFLGLSEAQIERDITDYSPDDEHKNEEGNSSEFKTKDSMEQLRTYGLETGDQPGFGYPVLSSEPTHVRLDGPDVKFDGPVGLHRAGSLPVRGASRKTFRHVSKLHSVPEEGVCRRKSYSCSNDPREEDDKQVCDDQDRVVDLLSERYDQPSDSANNTNPQG